MCVYSNVQGIIHSDQVVILVCLVLWIGGKLQTIEFLDMSAKDCPCAASKLQLPELSAASQTEFLKLLGFLLGKEEKSPAVLHSTPSSSS